MHADQDASVRAVVLTGADPALCAGLDLKEAQRDGAVYFERLHAENCIIKVAQLGKPVLGAINRAWHWGATSSWRPIKRFSLTLMPGWASCPVQA
jgi:enoyl-CoA hydratase